MSRRFTHAEALALWSRTVSLAADGFRNTEIGELQAISPGTGALWRARFAKHRLNGLLDAPPPGRPRPIGDDTFERVIVRALETTPTDATPRSTRSMAREARLTRR